MSSRILFINKVYPPLFGATGRILQELKSELEAKGLEIDVLSSKKKEPRFTSLLKMFFKSIFISKNKYSHVVIMTDPPFILLLAPIFKLKGIRVIRWTQDVYPDLFNIVGYKFFANNFFKWINSCLLKCCDKIIVIGRDMKKIMLKDYKIPENKLYIISNWADKEIKPLKSKRDKFTILYQGNLGKCYDFELLLNVAASLVAEKDVKFKIIGDGSQRKYIKKEIAKRNLHNIKLKTFVSKSEFKKSVANAHAHFIPVKKETLGLMVPCKIYCCFAAGLPCIFSGDKKSEPALLIKKYKCGKVSSSEREIVKTIKEWRNNPKLKNTYRLNAQKVIGDYGIKSAGEEFRKVIESCTIDNQI